MITVLNKSPCLTDQNSIPSTGGWVTNGGTSCCPAPSLCLLLPTPALIGTLCNHCHLLIFHIQRLLVRNKKISGMN